MIKRILTDLVIRWPYEFWLRIGRRVKLLIENWRVKQVIKEADLRHMADGKRYYVLKDGHGFPIALNKNQIKLLKKTGMMSRSVTSYDLQKECLYYTK